MVNQPLGPLTLSPQRASGAGRALAALRHPGPRCCPVPPPPWPLSPALHPSAFPLGSLRALKPRAAAAGREFRQKFLRRKEERDKLSEESPLNMSSLDRC